ncbi:hypothetical protein MLD38_030347 [Melastoma candidum]|uniref:Uncharacterized protein n=1 Tax=Melastoma candidum TaxID=119954 RepID=A0ACB9MN95_9MYRT|nr:hypothetical protein MLD38_030347 [Melastoma candidum]
MEMTACGMLLSELQTIWDEIGETGEEREEMLLELERECLQVYRRKVDKASQSRVRLRRAIADAEAELAAICSALGERPVSIKQLDPNVRSLKEEYNKILPHLEEMQRMKSDRRNQLVDVREQILSLSSEMYGSSDHLLSTVVVDETDLSLRKLQEFNQILASLHKEKNGRLIQVQEHLNALQSTCSVLGMDFQHVAAEVHASLTDFDGRWSITNHTIERLDDTIQKLREAKLQRMQKLQDLATTMLLLWDLMDTPMEEQQLFQNVTCKIAASEEEIYEPNILSEDCINQVAAEVARLEELKSSKMKELFLKKKLELEEICRKTHLIPELDTTIESSMEAIESGTVDPAYFLDQIETKIAKAKEEAFSRKELLDKVEKWLAACEEECWLEEYNRDDNRYHAGRGAHLALKRAEKARALVNKLPGMVEALALKALAWEKERGADFTYDGIRLLSMLEECNNLRQEKEQEQRRLREEKKIQGQLMAEREALYGSKPSPSKTQLIKKPPRMSTGGAGGRRRLSLGGSSLQTPKTDLHSMKFTPLLQPPRKSEGGQEHQPTQFLENISTTSAVGRRGLDIAGIPSREQSFDATSIAREPESPMTRNPFSPISITRPMKSNTTTDNSNYSSTDQQEIASKTQVSSSIFSTQSKTIIFADEENRTPYPPCPTTPSTVSIPMQTAITPVPNKLHQLHEVVKIIPEEVIEYSFEEKRAGFTLPGKNMKPMIIQA